ncbi:MAG: TlpA family protein disulfide reductase [Thermoguttaceae bacterium]
MRTDTVLGPPVRPLALYWVRLILPAALALALSGCADRSSSPHRVSEADHASETNAAREPVLRPETGQPVTVSLKKIDEAGLARAIENHRGNVVLVDFWATWCLPCVKMLPHTVALQRDWGKRGLNVITVSMDDPDEEARVRRTLEQNPAITENYLNRYESSTDAVEHFQVPEALPHIRIYDRTGRLRQSFPIAKKPFSPEDIDRVIEGLLAAQADG